MAFDAYSQHHQQHQQYTTTDSSSSNGYDHPGYSDEHDYGVGSSSQTAPPSQRQYLARHGTLRPADSVSQAGDDDDDRGAADDVDYANQREYRPTSQSRYDQYARPNDAYNRRQSSDEDDDAGSMVDGDTVVDRNRPRSRGHNKYDSYSDPYANNAYYGNSPYGYGNAVGGASDSKRTLGGFDHADVPLDDMGRKSGEAGRDAESGGIMERLRAKNRLKADVALDRSASYERPHWLMRQLYDNSPTEQKIANHRRGIGVQSRPWLCYVFGTIIVIVLAVELAQSAQRTGKVIQTSPLNYMIGPSSELLINVGARFTACMRDVPEISNMSFACLNSTLANPTVCGLHDICGFSSASYPHQTFRFFTAMWLHVGVVHLLLNGLALLFSSGIVEKQMGSVKFLVLYLLTGVFGFVLGGNFALVGLASMGASGAIFGTHAAVLVDLIAHWSLFDRPVRMLIGLLVEIIIGFGLGFIPGIDNFSHIGGFALGLLLSIVLLPAVHQTRSHRWVMWAARIGALVGAIVMFAVLYNNFFKSDPNSACQWCRYLSCWPTDANNHCKGTGLTTTTTTQAGTSGTVKRNAGLAVIYAVMYAVSQLR